MFVLFLLQCVQKTAQFGYFNATGSCVVSQNKIILGGDLFCFVIFVGIKKKTCILYFVFLEDFVDISPSCLII